MFVIFKKVMKKILLVTKAIKKATHLHLYQQGLL
jgi:hypothetical protein